MMISILTAFFLSQANAGLAWWVLFAFVFGGQVALSILGVIGVLNKKQ